MTRQPDHPHLVGEVLAAELRAHAHLVADLLDLGLQVQVAERPAVLVAGSREAVQVAGARELHGLEVELRGHAAHHDYKVVGRTGRGADGLELLLQELQHGRLVEQRRRLLVEDRLVGGAAALGDEQQLVGVPRGGVDLHLGRQVGAGVLLLVKGQGRELRVAQVGAGVDVVDAGGERLLVVGAGEDVLALLADDDGGAGVLARRQHAAGRDVGVLELLDGNEAVVLRSLGVVENGPQLGEVRGPEEMGDVADGLGGKLPQHRGVDLQDCAAVHLDLRHSLLPQAAVLGGVLTELEDGLELELRHIAGSP